MAKKNSKTKVAKDLCLGELLDEGKNIDMAKVNKIIEENKGTVEKVEEEVFESGEDITVDEDVDVPVDIAEEDKGTAEEEILMSEGVNEENEPSVEEEIENPNTEEAIENIDDVIAECTGEVESIEETPKKEEKKKDSEPWYVARARRVGDYYNW